MSEKQGPLLPAAAVPKPRRAPLCVRHWPLTALLCLGALYYAFTPVRSFIIPSCSKALPHVARPHTPAAANAGRCPQVDPLTPSAEGSEELARLDAYLASDAFANESVKRMAGAIQIPTVSYDDLGPVGEDPRWDVHYDMAAYLKRTFPRVHEGLRLEKINTHGLLFTWEGSEPALKPTVLMAHQDVVPVAEATADQWTHPPFSGAFDGTLIWGRGASDCKDQLIGSLEAVEELLAAGFVPRRTLVLAYGFDEEISGRQGAAHLAAALLDRYGPQSIASIVDEGSGIQEMWGQAFATPGVGEKGYVDIEVAVRTVGGHSSIPPPHTAIGILADLIAAIEDHPYEPWFAEENPFLGSLQCGAAHADEFPHKLKKLLPKAGRSAGGHKGGKKKKKDKLALEAAKMGPAIKYLFTTSSAVDIVAGGVKVNALPERVHAVVNHRINIGETSQDIKDHIAKVAAKVTGRHNLTLHAFDGEEEIGSVVLIEREKTLEPAPVSPTAVEGTTAYGVLAGTTRGIYEGVAVAPGLMTGNTDTRYYWDLSENIFRFRPGWDPEHPGAMDHIHTVDEKVSLKAHVKTVQWYSSFIRNMDEADLE